ncbi:MAG: transposase [Pseudomonadota bacterium]
MLQSCAIRVSHVALWVRATLANGTPTSEVCRRHGVSSATVYEWKVKFAGMGVPEAKRPKALEEKNSRLKRRLADAMLDNVALKDLLGKRGNARRST